MKLSLCPRVLFPNFPQIQYLNLSNDEKYRWKMFEKTLNHIYKNYHRNPMNSSFHHFDIQSNETYLLKTVR